MRLVIFWSTLLATLFLNVATAADPAIDYQHGNGALQLFDSKGMENSPRWVMIWIMFMIATFLCGLLFVKNHPIARWVVGGFFAGMVVSTLADSVLGVPQLSGFIALIHLIFWSPGLFQLLTKKPFLETLSPFTIWAGVMSLVIMFSFIFDIRDASLYLMHLAS
jgi:hypothetical protein